ncbi:hypothetical protein SPLC1_S371130 [Arthrospira platensis C1]|nr:hypothetical protein SPLC1_S371130 [Arthrospira platensis C1]
MILRKYRPDLKVFTIATKPTGLTVVTNLDFHSKVLSKNYDDIVKQYIAQDFINSLELRHAILSVVKNNWNFIKKTQIKSA